MSAEQSVSRVPHDLALACGCAGHCSILHVQHFDPFGDEQAEWFWDFYTRYGERSSWWWRIKLAWKVLWGRDHFCNATIWSDAEIEPLRRFLNAHLPPQPFQYANDNTSTASPYPAVNTNG